MGGISLSESEAFFLDHGDHLIALYHSNGSNEVLEAARGVAEALREQVPAEPLLIIIDLATTSVYVIAKRRLSSET